MTRPWLFTVTLAAAATVLLVPGRARAGGHHSTHVSSHSGSSVKSCADLHVRFDDLEVERAEETFTIAKAQVRDLKLEAAENGGIHVEGWSRPDYEVTVCKVAGGDDTREAREMLGKITYSHGADKVSVDGPDGGQWVAFLLVKAPKGAAMSLDATNGPVSLHEVDGTVNVRSVNGPVDLRSTTGVLDVSAVNGPISLSGGAGDLRLTAENGPLTVKLSGTHWEGAGLTASTENGPVSLRMPESYDSGVEVTASRHSPMSCRGADCPETPRGHGRWNDDDDERPRRLRLGSGSTSVKLSTVNGPVSVDRRG